MNQDLRLKTNTAERDQAVIQLAETYNITEHLKSENESLRREITQLRAESDEQYRKWQENEAALHRKIQRRDQAISQLREISQDITHTQHEINNTTKFSASRATKRMHTSRKAPEQVKLPQSKSYNELPTTRGRVSTGQASSASHAPVQQRLRSTSRSQSRHLNKQAEAQDDHDEDTSVSDTTDEGSFDNTTKTIHKNINVTSTNIVDDVNEETNFSSILGDDLIRLREAIANNRQILADRENAAAYQPADDTLRSTRSQRSNNTSQRKSGQGLTGILKNRTLREEDDATGKLSVKSAGSYKQTEREHTTKSEASHQRRHSENAVQSRTRRRVSHEEMTSAFILPDITFHTSTHKFGQPVLSESARRKLDQLCQHDVRNCTICSRVTSFETIDGKTVMTEAKQTVLIEKPVPVSERMPEMNLYEDEPTMRPATAPGNALATVIKSLKDEINHLKIELHPLQILYNKHDPSLGMRKRKSISSKITKLLKEIERKSDQLYQLYDVLEGQKQSGQEMSEKEIEITLQNIGFNPENLNDIENEAEDKQAEDGDSDEDSDLDLPWEGIDDTTGSKRHSFRL